MQKWLLYLTILIEGYVVLAVELLAIRQLTPFVGSSTDTISIIIAAVLLPLAIGYYAGGSKKFGPDNAEEIRSLLARNLFIAGLIFVLGFVHIHVGLFFDFLSNLGIQHRLSRTILYCLLFMVYPMYLLGQTIPLASQGLPQNNLAQLTGRMLFFSTLGSFLGSVVSTIILMAWLGVHNTFTLTLTMLLALVIILINKPRHALTLASCLLLAYVAATNSNKVLAQLKVVQNNAYNQVRVFTLPDASRVMSVNGSASSKLTATSSKQGFPYIEFIESNIIRNLNPYKKHSILVIGAGGFTLGINDTFNHYTYLDIDPALKETSEKHFLKEKLTPNKTFITESARSYLASTQTKYDVIVVDAYSNPMTIPTELVTVDFFLQIKNNLAPGGIMATNIIASPSFESPFSRAIDLTMRTVFPYVSRQIVITPEHTYASKVTNIIYTYIQPKSQIQENAPRPYTDDLNRYFLHH